MWVAEGRAPKPFRTIVTRAYPSAQEAAAQGRRLRLGGMKVRPATAQEREPYA